MRAKEFIVREARDFAGGKEMSHDQLGALPGVHAWPELDNSSGYLAYRFGVATGLKMVTIGYTPAEQEILNATQGLVGTPKVRITSDRSTENADVNKVSPVSNWNKQTLKKSKK